ncbi:MAG: FkbM family methyltransferase [Ferruginibacter sp.]
MFKDFLIKHFPSLGKYKRFIVAVVNSIAAVKKSYSQHGEDVFILETLQQYDLQGSMYLDIGANHPTDISNTYLLYRHKMQGIIIEPNEELIKLFRRFRKRDIPLMIGCSNTNAILKFNISSTPVVSSFSDDHSINIHRSVYLPVMKLDDAIRNLPIGFISFLSIDVEGLNYEVLEGGKNTIAKCLLICIEFDTEADRQKISVLLQADFDFLKTFGCNLFFINRELRERKILRG